MRNKIALAVRKMETLLGAEFETLDWILYLNVDVKTFFDQLTQFIVILTMVLIASSLCS